MRTKLTAKGVEKAKVANGKTMQRFHDGQGLYLSVRKSGTKAWELRFTKPDGRGSNLGLGKYPEVSLLEARKLAAEFRKLRAQGKDLAVEHKKKEVRSKTSSLQHGKKNRRVVVRNCG